MSRFHVSPSLISGLDVNATRHLYICEAIHINGGSSMVQEVSFTSLALADIAFATSEAARLHKNGSTILADVAFRYIQQVASILN